MAFPETILPITVELDINGTWTNVSSDVYERDEIRIRRGRSAETEAIVPSACNFTLNNAHGKYSPKNPRSPYYGAIGRNTPVRVSVDAGSSYLMLPGASGDSATTPDAAALDITGDLDIRVDFTSGALQDVNVVNELAGKYLTTGDQRSWYLTTSNGFIVFRWSSTGTLATSIDVTSTEGFPIPRSNRIALRVTHDVDNGAGGSTTTFYTSDSIDGTWIQLGDPVINSGVTTVFSSTANLEIGSLAAVGGQPLDGQVHAFQLRNGIAGSVVANPDFAAQAAGVTSFADSAGRTWTVNGGASISNRKIRFLGEVSSWPVRWGTGGDDVYVEVEAAGILRRLGQGAAPLKSTLRRTIPNESTLLAYWPFEDEEGSTRVASAMAGGPSLNGQGLDFAADSALAGSSPLAKFESDSGATRALFFGSVPDSAVPAPQWSVEFAFNADSLETAYQDFIRVGTTGTVDSWTVGMSSTGFRILGQFDGAAAGLYSVTDTWANISGTAPVGDWYRCELYIRQFHASIEIYLRWKQGDTVVMDFFTTRSDSIVGRVTGIGAPVGGSQADMDGISIGHVAVFSNTQTIFNEADLGFTGETAGFRMKRLCSEEEVSFFLHGNTNQEVFVGPQRPARFLDLLQEAADADHGILYEERDQTALAFQDRRRLYNQTPDLTLDYAGSDGLVVPLEPVDDDRYLRNDVMVQRQGGSSARAVQETGPLSVQAPPDGVGIYSEQTTLTLYNDDQLPQHASWLLHMGTWDETRYPTVTVLLQNAVHLIDDVARVDIGSRLDITNPPTWLPPDTIELMAQGYTEILHQYRWELSFATSPAGPYRTAVVGAAASRIDTGGSELAAGVTSSATALSVTTTSGPLWTTNGAHVPFDITVGGERMTVTAISGASSPQAFTVTRSVNSITKSHSAGAAVQLFAPVAIPL
ncbi:hypothetical protein GLX30_30480 [Streptomyces sp. Tu 2975]|uniref:hypothetical protein n=1 Tax=Streptomyces sp. Tu 2975 TaxID=2676871 RepID=UPI00135BDDD9|nr:hypothetical protein [Streptomyces sp. Tu 2975]QIP87641.1 hypothetical protein GLX30_30480 [Streptomyces sp. Tu 2975]